MAARDQSNRAAHRARRARRAVPALLLALAGLGPLPGCVAEPNEDTGWVLLDRSTFACTVEPVLEHECSMPACHGAPSRRMQVLAPGRMRLAGELAKAIAAQSADERLAGLHPALTEVEIDANFASARAMLLPGAPESSPLLDKPLAIDAGGVYHAPAGSVFASKQSPGYVALLNWASGKAVCP